MDRIARSFRLMKQSYRVLMQDKELMLLPVLSGLVMLLVIASFVVPVGLLTDGDVERNMESWVGFLLLFAFYVVSYTVGIYFQAAIVAGATQRLQGGDPTLGSALGAASRHFPSILMWGFIAGTVGLVIRMIEERSEVVGRIVMGIVGVVWTLATFFVVPLLVLEGVGTGEALKRSWGLFKKTWGETVVGAGGVWLASMVFFLPLGVIVYLLIQADLVVVGVVIGLLGFAAISIFFSALQGVYVASLYRYATVGEARGFDEGDLRGAFRPKP